MIVTEHMMIDNDDEDVGDDDYNDWYGGDDNADW